MQNDLSIARAKVKDCKYILFDFDGTLVNLDELNVRSFKIVFSQFNISFTTDDFMKYISGRGSVDGMREYLAAYEIFDYDPAKLNSDFDSTKRSLIADHFEEVITKIPGISEFLQWSKENGKRAVIATSSLREYVKKVLSRYEMLDYFESIFDRTDVDHGKPAPDLFLKARDFFGAKAEECVIFEDSRFGLRSAKAAGIYTIGVLNPGWNDTFVHEMADSVIKDYQEVM